ncbi:T-cell surface antigen CD2-like [Aquarana catesbeiana]|uniref:T-cell surface antigen CD2-like n=1 Tax=Aquarana catesbeiana TaxID=8400 RepID=UPI003CC956B0
MRAPFTMRSQTALLLLCVLLQASSGNVSEEEIFTRPGSDLLLPIRRHLTLNHPDTRRCDEIEWIYEDPTSDYYTTIFIHKGCRLRKYEDVLFSNTRLSENGSLIISNVTPENDGIYSVILYNSTGDRIQTDDYTVHVEVPVSVPLLHVSCLWNGSAEISCRVEEGTRPNIRLSVIGRSQERYSTSANHITAIVGSLGPWNITCTVKNGVSRSESRAGVTCPGEETSEVDGEMSVDDNIKGFSSQRPGVDTPPPSKSPLVSASYPPPGTPPF